MQFSDITNKNGAIQLCEDLCKLGDSGITSDTTLFKKFTNFINQGDKRVVSGLLTVDKNWRFDDSKYTDFPIATIDLENDVRDYTLPPAVSGGNASTLYKINKVRVKDTSGLFYPLSLLDPQAQETQEGLTYNGIPTRYRLVGNSIRLDPKPLTGQVTLTGGLEITFQRASQVFTTSSTTEEFGYMDSYHDLPCYYASYMYLLPIDRQLALDYLNLFESWLKKLQYDWFHKNSDVRNVIRPKVRNPQ